MRASLLKAGTLLRRRLFVTHNGHNPWWGSAAACSATHSGNVTCTQPMVPCGRFSTSTFDSPATRGDLRDWSQWWTFRFGANWRYDDWIGGRPVRARVQVDPTDPELSWMSQGPEPNSATPSARFGFPALGAAVPSLEPRLQT